MNRVSRGLAPLLVLLLCFCGGSVSAQESILPAGEEDLSPVSEPPDQDNVVSLNDELPVDVDEASTSNDVTLESGPALAEPVPPKVSSIAALAALSRSAIMVVAIGEYDATGFLISLDPPLVVTVAHAATLATKPEDIIVRLNETGASVAVRAFHIHPGFRKQATPQDLYSPDLAILELEPTEIELGQPLKFTLPNWGRELRGLEVISLGFPTYATLTGERESAESIIQHGVIQRMINFDGNTTSMPPAQRPLFEHSFETSPGESGSPILDLASGQVIGVHHGTRRVYKKGTRELITVIPVAVRIELLWELLEQEDYVKAVAQPAP